MVNFDGFFDMLDRLDQVRKSMAGAKNTKLMRQWEKRGDYKDAQIPDLVDHIFEEWEEFIVAIDPGTKVYYAQARAPIRDEVIDLVNCLEMLWDILDLGGA